MLVRVTLASLAAGLLLSFVGAFGLDDDPPLIRTAWIVAASLFGAALDVAAYQAALAVPAARGRLWARIIIAAALVALPMSLVVWASLWMLGGRPSVAGLAIGFGNAFIVGGAFIAAFVAPPMDAAVRRAGAARSDADPGSRAKVALFMERLPPDLQLGELWALEAEDHYLRVHTSRGETLLRLRLADALREVAEVAGAQTHRSWWVARAAVRDVRRGDGKVTLVLPNGREVAVSRAIAKDLRAAGWLEPPRASAARDPALQRQAG